MVERGSGTTRRDVEVSRFAQLQTSGRPAECPSHAEDVLVHVHAGPVACHGLSTAEAASVVLGLTRSVESGSEGARR